MGRALVDDDERAGCAAGRGDRLRGMADAASEADPRILERTVRLDDTVHAIVGVMPAGFGFPSTISYWVPLRVTRDIGDDRCASSRGWPTDCR